jgi:hypothetical protein
MANERESQRRTETSAPAGKGKEPIVESLDLVVSGDFIDNVYAISSAAMSILITIGRVKGNEKDILIPYLDVKLVGEQLLKLQYMSKDEQKSEALFANILPFDNVAFVIADLALEFRGACHHLHKVAGGNIRPVSAHIESSRQYLVDACKQLQECIGELDAIVKDQKRS